MKTAATIAAAVVENGLDGPCRWVRSGSCRAEEKSGDLCSPCLRNVVLCCRRRNGCLCRRKNELCQRIVDFCREIDVRAISRRMRGFPCPTGNDAERGGDDDLCE